MIKTKKVRDIMTQNSPIHKVDSQTNLKQVVSLFQEQKGSFLPVCHAGQDNIVGILYERDLFRIREERKAMDIAKPPWFITEDGSLLEIIRQFQRNKQNVAVVLNQLGKTVGLLTLDQIIDDLFSGVENIDHFPRERLFIDKSFPGAMRIAEFNAQFDAHIAFAEQSTLSDLIADKLEHPPKKGDSIQVDCFEMTVLEHSLLGAKEVHIKTITEE